MRFCATTILLLSLAITGLHAQDSLRKRHLQQVEVISHRHLAELAGTKTLAVDSAIVKAYQQNTLAELLTQQTSVFIKSYGPGALATSSFRGAGAAHTMVLWNGFNLQSPTNGQLDLSLIPAVFLDEVSVQYGGSGTRRGSGAMGGAIVLNNNQEFDKGLSLKVGTGIGSFGFNSQQFSIAQSGSHYTFSLKTFNEEANNKFPFTNTSKSGNPVELESNNQLQQRGFLQENYFKISEKQTANARLWYLYANRQIPPTLTEGVNTAYQKDESWRGTADWKYTGSNVIYTMRTAYINEKLNYIDDLNGFNSSSSAQSYIGEGETKYNVNATNSLSIGLNNTYSRAFIKDYNKTPTRNSFALFAAYAWSPFNGKLKVQGSARQEWVTDNDVPFVPAIGVEWAFAKDFLLKTSLNKVFRIPTFNDLYWTAGGNPNLKPENGWSREIGLAAHNTIKNIATIAELTFFDRNIENWILWQPTTYGYWTPTNAQKVYSYGTEASLKFDVPIKKAIFRLSGLGNYVISTNSQVKSANDESLGKQLIYVPLYTAQANVGLFYRSLFINYNYTYTGYRYTSSDNYEYLTPFRTGNVQLTYSYRLSKYEFSFNFQANNIWGEVYQSVAERPMPLINYKAGIIIKFNK